jgi:hypothetical protein
MVGYSISVFGDDDEGEEHERSYKQGGVAVLNRKSVYKPVVLNSKFKTECTSCHMAYLPGLLPARSWEKMMTTLDNHFGEDASLDEKTKKEILDFLILNSSDKAYGRRGTKILATISSNDAPLRISETAYFNRKHDEISPAIFKRKSIGSKANCLACHKGAESGNFEEDDVIIPKDIVAPVKKK